MLSQEKKWIHLLQELSQSPYIGDDCAYIEEKNLLITTDSLVEDIHFRWEFSKVEEVAKKLITMNASDLLAKGVYPKYALFSAHFRRESFFSYAEEFAKSLIQKLKSQNILLIGGNTTSSLMDCFSLTLFAFSSNKPIPRKNPSQIQEGDVVYLSGEIGGAYYALKKLLGRKEIPEEVRKAYSSPSPFWDAPKWLKEIHARVSIDLSDSLYESLMLLAEENQIHIEIDLDKIPMPSFVEIPYEEKPFFLLESAEDYAILAIGEKKEGISYPIGHILSKGEARLSFLKEGKEYTLPKGVLSTYRHF